MHNISKMRIRSQRSDAAELEAESTADSVVRGGGPVSVSQTPAAAISCWSAGYNDVKDDFWGFKKTYGSAYDSAINTA